MVDDAIVKPQDKQIIIDRPVKKKYKKGVTPAFAAMVDTFMKEHNDVLQKLAKK